MKNDSYLTVTALTKYIKRKFDADPHLGNIFVKGEISNFKSHSSGHLYFSLKDERARIAAVMFSTAASAMKFVPENGMHVFIRGSITVYEQTGQYQIYVQQMQPDGIGELFLAFEQLKKKLEVEGLFNSQHKKSLPLYPRTIGVITSPTGAAVRDIMTTIQRRYPIAKVIIIPTLVQGKQAARSIARSIQRANERNIADVLIVGRGGGSIEELWAFNEEVVARAIFDSMIPIISAVGHETDFTIADFVADVRAATPTGAAELAVPHMEELLNRLLHLKNRLYRRMAEIKNEKSAKLKYLQDSYIFRYPHKLYEQKWEKVDRIENELEQNMMKVLRDKTKRLATYEQKIQSHHPKARLQLSTEKLKMLKYKLNYQFKTLLNERSQSFLNQVATLEALNPLKILQRGFSLAYTDDGTLIKSVENHREGDQMKVQVIDGHIYCTINDIEKGEHN